MGLTAKLAPRRHTIQATCDKCGIKSEVIIIEHRQDGYILLRQRGWFLRTTKKEALCKGCAGGD